MLILALGDLPDAWYEVLLLPVFFAAIGVIVWVAGRNAELKDQAKPWKWLAALPFALALITGVEPLLKIRDFFYAAAIRPFGEKMQIAHYAAFLVPLLCVVGLAAWEVIYRKVSSHQD